MSELTLHSHFSKLDISFQIQLIIFPDLVPFPGFGSFPALGGFSHLHQLGHPPRTMGSFSCVPDTSCPSFLSSCNLRGPMAKPQRHTEHIPIGRNHEQGRRGDSVLQPQKHFDYLFMTLSILLHTLNLQSFIPHSPSSSS